MPLVYISSEFTFRYMYYMYRLFLDHYMLLCFDRIYLQCQEPFAGNLTWGSYGDIMDEIWG